MKNAKFPDFRCPKCASYRVLLLKDAKTFSCLNCSYRWIPGQKRFPRLKGVSLEKETLAFIRERQKSGLPLLEVQGHYLSLKRERRRKKTR